MTPREAKIFINALNKEFKDERRKFKWETSDFYKHEEGKEAQGPYTVDDIRKKLTPEQQEVFDKVAKQLGDKFPKFMAGYTQYPSLEDKPTKEAFVSIKSPKTKGKDVGFYDWQAEELGIPKSMAKDSNTLLKKMSAKERNDFISKLEFPAVWDKEKNELKTEIPLKPKYFNMGFYTDKFMAAANNLLSREGKVVDKEKLIEDLAAWFDAVGTQEFQYRDTDESLLEMVGDYAVDDAKHKNFKDLQEHLDEEIQTYIEKLQDLGISEDDIKEDLIESSEETVNRNHYNVDNSIGSSTGSSEEEIPFGDGSNEMKDEKQFPYPDDLDANLSLLNAEDIKKLERTIGEMWIKFKPDDTTGGYKADYGTISLGDSNYVYLVVDPSEFIAKAKRRIKDYKLSGKNKKPLKQKESETSMEHYPTVSMCLAADETEAANIDKKIASLPPAVKRGMIANLYEGIARNILPMEEDRIHWMVNYIHENMTDKEVEREWKSIQDGSVAKLVQLFKSLGDPEILEKHMDKVEDLQLLHHQLAEGFQKTKEAGKEVDDKTYDALQKIVMDFADEFVAEIQGDKAIAPAKDKKLLNEYPALSKVLGG